MQLDQTRIAIREREFLDLADLAVRVISSHAGGLLIAWAAGVLPLIALDTWLLSQLVEKRNYLEQYPESQVVVWGLLLFVWQVPWGTAFVTLFLGQAMFQDRPSARQVAAGFFGSFWQLLWYQGIRRAVLTFFWITWFALFASSPFANEVILLERNPLRGRHRNDMTTGRRIRNLHSGLWGDLFGRWILSLMVGGVLAGSLFASLRIAAGVLVGVWESSLLANLVLAQLAAWLVVGYFAVVRYLGYLDLRIRREGWEVELLMRAEGARQRRQWT